MSKQSQGKLSHQGDKPLGWDLAIIETEKQIKAAEERIAKLRLSLGSFRTFKERGEPWPGDTASSQRAHGT